MRRPPAYQRLEVRFSEDAFRARATLAFEANFTDDVAAAQHISVQAGRRGTWVLAFAPLDDLPEGARVAFVKLENEYRFAWRHQDYWPDAMDYVTVEDAAGARLPFECETEHKSKVPAIVHLPRSFRAGEGIVVRMGDQREGGRGSVVQANCYECVRIASGVMLPGDEAFRRCPDAEVSVRVAPCPPVKRYYLFAPSTPEPGEEFAAVALPVDVNGNAVAPSDGVRIGLPGEAQAAEPDVPLPADVHVPEDGVVRLCLEDDRTGLRAASNPVRFCAGAEYGVYWGELHWHGYDGVEMNVLNQNTDPDAAFRYGRDVTRLDFSAMGSHIFRHAPEAVHEWWDLYREAARRHDEEGRHVTFMGCEWRDREPEGGDRNLVWRDLDAPVPDPTWKIEQVYECFRGHPAMVTPHVGGCIAMPCKHDPEVETLCEMTSGHGNFEWFAQAYLSKGYRVGLIGGSDGHKGTPGHPRMAGSSGGRFPSTLRRRDVGWVGGPILGVLAEGLDRQSIWDAFRARRTYATTGARALLDLHVNDAVMGSEIGAERDVKIEVAIEGTDKIERVDLIRNQSRLQRWQGGALRFQATYVDRPPDGVSYYYVRVEQQDGEMLWSSPVWVDSACGGSDPGLPAWNEPEAIELKGIGDNPAGAYLEDLLRYLRTEENIEAFSDLTPLKMVRSPLGRYAVFLGRLHGHRIRIHWFPDFEIPRLRLEAGWVQYGRERIYGAPWAKPVFPPAEARA